MIDRIKKIMEKERLNSASFADKIGVSRGTITHVLTGRNNPSLEVIQKILDKFPTISAEWLLVGKNSMYGHEKTFYVLKKMILFYLKMKLMFPTHQKMR